MSLTILADNNIHSLTYVEHDAVITMLELPNDNLWMSD